MARSFPGTNGNGFTVADVAAVDVTSVGTFAAWVYPAAMGAERNVIGKRGNVAGSVQWQLDVRASGVPFGAIGDAAGEDDVQSATAIGANVWSHLCLVKAGTGANALRLYRNGVLDTQETSNRVMQNRADAAYFGHQSDAFWTNFNGRIAEIGIWNIGLTTEEIVALAKGVSPALISMRQLVGYWPLLGVAAPEACLTPYAGNATLIGSAPAAAHGPAGRWSVFSG